MKKTLYLFAAVAFFTGLASCSDQNDVVDDLIDGIKHRPVVRQVEYTLTAADYASVSAAALRDAGDSSADAALATAVRTTNSLNSFATGDKYIPALLAAKYPALGLESVARVTYAYTPDYLVGLTTAPGYLPVFLSQKFPYAQEGDRKAVLYDSGKDEYIFTGGRWTPTLTGALLTEQFVNDGSKWIFDPTVKFVMSNDDYVIMVDYMLADPARAVYVDADYRNEEWYYGFGWRYDNVSFRLSYRTGNYNRFSRHDTELHALDGKPAEQAALLWRRLEQEGMPLFLSLKYPLSPATAQGVQLYYEVTVSVFYPDGVTNTTMYYRMRYKVSTAGSAVAPPTFEFVSTEELGTSLP